MLVLSTHILSHCHHPISCITRIRPRFTTPRWGEVGSRSEPGEGVTTTNGKTCAPHPIPLPGGERESRLACGPLRAKHRNSACGEIAVEQHFLRNAMNADGRPQRFIDPGDR